jgi:protein-L-isoaspartate(D-aspartate) O-methyltransferase
VTKDFLAENEKMVNYLINTGVLKTPKIIEAFRKIPRHLFVPNDYIEHAYDDMPLPTYAGQTISQPYTIAFMTEQLEPKSGEKILEIGSGSGYQAALLGSCVAPRGKVITVELEEELVEFANKNLNKAKIKNVKVIQGDGKLGYSKEAPYNKAIITAACPEIPQKVIEQLKVGGRLVAPVNSGFAQKMMVIDKISDKEFKERNLGSFVFVPLR